nr:NAD-dependent epimerase/dehydratase family protein [Rhodoplanes serenus]
MPHQPAAPVGRAGGPRGPLRRPRPGAHPERPVSEPAAGERPHGEQPTSGRVLVLGAAGRIGYATAAAFQAAGWQVASLVRGSAAHRCVPGTTVIGLDARDRASVIEAASGADVIVHALNTPYAEWPTSVPDFAETAIAAARAAGATLMVPDPLFAYGAGMPSVIDEETPLRPTARKGVLRAALAERLRAEAEDGLRVVLVRAGDVYGGGIGWLDRVVVNHLPHGRLAYPGPLDLVHAWAYLPDLAATLVRLAERRTTLPAFAPFGFPGHAVTGRVLTTAIVEAVGRPLKIDRMQWWMLRAVAPLVPIFRELCDVAYLWSVPHRIDGTRLAAAVGTVPHTPFEAALADALYALGATRRA